MHVGARTQTHTDIRKFFKRLRHTTVLLLLAESDGEKREGWGGGGVHYSITDHFATTLG